MNLLILQVLYQLKKVRSLSSVILILVTLSKILKKRNHEESTDELTDAENEPKIRSSRLIKKSSNSFVIWFLILDSSFNYKTMLNNPKFKN